jgi:hypothetical protein
MKISCLIELLEAFNNIDSDLEVEFEVIKFPELGVALTPFSTDTNTLLQG